MTSERNPERQDKGETVFLIDDDRDVRDALAGLLRSVDLSVQAFASVEEFMASGRSEAPGCLILDVRLSGRSGLAFQLELKADGSKMPIIFVSGHADVAMAVRAMRLGAIDFLTKPLRHQELIDSINLALQSDRARRAAEHATAMRRLTLDSLSPREREVVDLIAAGLTNSQAATRLGIIEATVKAHRSQIMKKLGVTTFASLMRRAIELGL